LHGLAVIIAAGELDRAAAAIALAVDFFRACKLKSPTVATLPKNIWPKREPFFDDASRTQLILV